MTEPTVFQRAGNAADRLVRRYMPDPFVLVLALTIIVFAAGVAAVHWHGVSAGPRGGLVRPSLQGAAYVMRGAMFSGFSDLLTFGMQMVLIVVTGEALATAPPVARAIRRAARIPRTQAGALLLVSSAALVLGWVHWGFGLMAAATFAREVAASCRERNVRVHYPLLGTAAYMSMLLWHAGISASAPLLINTPRHFLADVIGIVPLSQTIFLPVNLVVCAVLAAIIPFVIAAMRPAAEHASEIPAEFVRTFRDDATEAPSGATYRDATSEAAPAPHELQTPAARLDALRIWSLVPALLGLWFVVHYFRERASLDLNHNVLNFAFLMLGLALHRSPVEYGRAIAQSVKGTSGIVLQFPFYGAIMAMMKQSGLGELIADQFVALATAHTLPFFTYLASLLTKLFVPSGGGEWAVEGPVMLRAAQRLGAPVGLTTMGVAYGNMAGNMFQPFWALPLLGILGLRARDVMGYSLVVFVVAAPVLGVALLIAAR
ncbi:MAG: TIGR00366 family protein [Deltaproteobacteria bacterium]